MLLGKNTKWDELFRFAVVGVGNTLLYLGLVSLFHYIFHWPALVANSLGFILAVANSFLWNKFWTFRRLGGRLETQFIHFLMVNLIGLGISDTLVYLLNIQLHISLLLVTIISSIAVMTWNFFGYKYLVFRYD